MTQKNVIKGWRRRALTQSSGEKHELETLAGYWVSPKKLSLDVMQQITDGQGIDIDSEDFTNKSEDEIREAIEHAYQKRSGKKFSLGDKSFQNMLKLAFLHGVADHNFNRIVDAAENEVPVETLDAMSDIEFEKKLENGALKNVKETWDETLYTRMREFTETLFEIFKIVMQFNRPLVTPTSKKSAT